MHWQVGERVGGVESRGGLPGLVTRLILLGPLSVALAASATAELFGDVAGADQRDLVDPALVVGIDVGMLLSHEPSLTQTFGP